MRVIPRRRKGRRQDGDPARTTSPQDASSSQEGRPPAEAIEAAQPFYPGQATRPMEAAPDTGPGPAKALERVGPREGTRKPDATTDRTREPDATTTVLPPVTDPEEAQRRRARAAERRRVAAEMKRSRAARRQGLPYREAAPAARAADQHRSAMLVMVLTLGLLIAAVAVTGAMIATSMRTRPVTLEAPLRVYPVTQSTPGQCPTGTQGITAQSGAGPTCYRLSEGIAIHKVADMRVQKSRVKPGGYDVAVTLRPGDRDAFAQLTRATVGRDLAFVVRDRVVTLPRVDMAITDGKVVVTGPPNRAAADRLVRELKGR